MKYLKFSVPFLLSLFLCLPIYAQGGNESGAPIKELRISYVKAPFNLQIMVMKELGLLEKEFADDGIEIKWFEIVSGAKQAEAMAAGSLDIASVMNSASVIIGNAAGNAIDIIDIVSRPRQTFAVMVMDDGPESVKDLAGSVVAGPKGTVLHQMLVSIEEKEHLDNVKLVSMGLSQSQSSLIAGDVDAALLAGSLLIKTQEAGGRILTTSEGYVTPLLVSVSPQIFVENHPDIIKRYTAVQQEAFEYIETHLTEALAIGAKAQDLSNMDAADLFRRSGIANQITAEDLSCLSQDIEFLLDLDMIEESLDASSLIGETLSVQGE